MTNPKLTKKALVSQGCWVVAVIAAFGLGTLRRGGGNSESVVPGTPGKSARIPQDFRETAHLRGSRQNNLRAESREAGLIVELFGKSTPDTADWEALARQAVRDSNPISRRLAFSRLLASLTPDNALEIREQLVSFGADGEQWRDFNYSWGALAGMEAFTFAASSEERDLDAVLTGWASADPNGALALLDNLPEDMKGSRDRLAANVVAGLADRDPTLATDLVLRLAREGAGQPENLIAIVASETLRTSSPEEAAAWSETLPDGALKGAAMGRIANAYVERDPEAAARWAQRHADQDYAARAIEQVADKWAEREPVEAVTWLQNLPEGRGQVAGLRSVFGDWEDRDPVAAGEYLLSMPRSAQRDSAISGFSTGYAWQDPQTAIAWAQDISDPSLRQQSLARAGQAFFRKDPNSARIWLESSGLPPEVREAVINPPRRR